MAKDQSPDDGSGLGEVHITVVVVPGRVRATLTGLLAGARVRAGLVSAGLVAAVVAGTILVASTGRDPRSSVTYSPWPTDSNRLATQFGLRLNCARITVFSPDGAYARIDLDHTGPCATFGNRVTLILHRVHGIWMRELEASRWKCPMSRLPQPVASELGVCGRTVVPSRPVARSPRGVL
jgi:hypothetical protein